MPQLIQHIDQIARQKQRDVLLIQFDWELIEDYGCWDEVPIRQQIVAWLETEGILWQPCAHFAIENGLLSYCGQIYVDVPYGEGNADFKKLSAYLEHEDGTMRWPEVAFCYLTLDTAMKNAHHDEPGFWEKWAEDF